MPGVLILDELQSATEGGGIKLAAPLQTQDGADLLSPSGQVSVNFDNVANNSIHMNKLIVPDDIMSGDKIHGGIISGFTSEGITDNSSNTVITIHSNENVGIGTTSPGEKLQVTGNITASGDVTSTSDARVKTDIKPITGALDIVNKLEGKRFNKFNKPGIGFIAQELEQYIPELVHTANDEVGTKSVNYANMVALLVEAIKEQQVTINKLESKLNGN